MTMETSIYSLFLIMGSSCRANTNPCRVTILPLAFGLGFGAGAAPRILDPLVIGGPRATFEVLKPSPGLHWMLLWDESWLVHHHLRDAHLLQNVIPGMFSTKMEVWHFSCPERTFCLEFAISKNLNKAEILEGRQGAFFAVQNCHKWLQTNCPGSWGGTAKPIATVLLVHHVQPHSSERHDGLISHLPLRWTPWGPWFPWIWKAQGPARHRNEHGSLGAGKSYIYIHN